MTVANGSPYWLQVGGTWRHLEGVAPGVQVAQERPTSTFTSLGNVRYAKVARKALRSWGLSFVWDDAEASRHLDDAAANPDDPAWLHDVNLAQINMLPASLTKGGSTVTLSVDGRTMRAFTAGATFTSRLRAGVTYHLSYTTTHTAAATIGTYDVGAGAVNIVAPAGTGARRGSVSFTPSSDVTLAGVWTVADKTSGARLTEGSVDSLGFLESRGVTPCRVLVGDGSATFNMAWDDQLALADSAYVVTEVG